MGSSDKFCLRWNDFETNISAAFQELRNDEDFFDVTLCCGPDGTDRLRAHKVILSACSPFFRGILKNNPHANPLIYLRGVTMEDLNALLNFMYHGEANVTQEDLNSFLAVAEDLDVKGLTSNDQEKATKRAGVDTAKFKRKSSGGAVSAKKRKVEDETAFDEGSAVVKSETVSDDTFADDFSLEESYADEEGGNGDYDKSAGDDLEDYGEEGDPVAGTSSDGAKDETSWIRRIGKAASRSGVWNHLKVNRKDETLVKCDYCDWTSKNYSSTSNYWTHLKRLHNIEA